MTVTPPRTTASGPDTPATDPDKPTYHGGPHPLWRLRLGMRWLRVLSHRQRQTLLMMLLALTTGVEFFENIMFVFASSHIVGGIDADPRGFAVVQAAYAVGSMLMILKQQWLSRRFGYRYYLTGSMLVFMAGTLGAATSHSLSQMVTARFVQGLGGGALFTSCRVLVNVLFAAADRPRAARTFMLGIFCATAIAPAFAAELIERGVWQDVFYGVLPFAALSALGCWLLLPDTEPRKAPEGGPALVPLLLFGAGIIALQAALSEARFDVFSHPVRLAITATAALALLGTFLWNQWHHHDPVLRLRALQHPAYLTGMLVYCVYYTINNLAGYVFPIFAEQALKLPLATTGWLNSFAGVVSLAGLFVYNRHGGKLGHKKPLIVAGLLVMAGAMWWFSRMPPDATTGVLMVGLVGKGLFGIAVIIPVAGLTFRSLAAEDFAHGYRTKNLVRQIASSFSSALGAVLLQNRQFAVHDSIAGALGQRTAESEGWMRSLEAAMAARGFDAAQAHQGALAQLAGMVEQQARLIACEDLYRLIAVLALVTAGLILAQRQID